MRLLPVALLLVTGPVQAEQYDPDMINKELSSQVSACWNPPISLATGSYIVAIVDLEKFGVPARAKVLDQNIESENVRNVSVDAAMRAIRRCGPYSMKGGQHLIKLQHGSSDGTDEEWVTF